VHQAPAFGEDDYRVCRAHGIISAGTDVPCPVDDAGCFTEVPALALTLALGLAPWPEALA